MLPVLVHTGDVIGAGDDPVSAIARGPENVRAILLKGAHRQLDVVLRARHVEKIEVEHALGGDMRGARRDTGIDVGHDCSPLWRRR